MIVLWIFGVAFVLRWAWELRKESPLTRPLGTITRLYGRVFILYMLIAALLLSHGFVLGGGGPRGSVCVPAAVAFSGGAGPGHVAKAGALLTAVGHFQVCAQHPGPAQWALFLLTKLPYVLWGVVLLLIWRLIRRASGGGPFTPQVAATMRQLGWVVIGGSLIAGALGALGADLLTRMLMTPATYDGGGIVFDVLVRAPFKALVPAPAIAGAALLSFAQIIRAGAVLDEEIKATV